jgi:hypothetical protein
MVTLFALIRTLSAFFSPVDHRSGVLQSSSMKTLRSALASDSGYAEVDLLASHFNRFTSPRMSRIVSVTKSVEDAGE